MNAKEVTFSIDGLLDHTWIEIPTEGEPLLVGCVYRSPSDDINKDKCMKISKSISRLIDVAYKSNENILIAGDFNFKEIDWVNEYAPPEKEHLTDFITTLQECYLYQHVTEPTRYRINELPNLLDLVLSGEEGMIQNIEYLPPLGESDHVCLRFDVLHTHQVSRPSRPSEPDIRKTNYESVKEDLSKHNWEEELNSNFVEDYDVFINSLLHYVDKHSPRKLHQKLRKNIFMTNAALRLKNRKQRHWKRYVATKTTHDLRNYTRTKNELRGLARKLRRDFEQNLVREIKTKPKLFWKYARSRLKAKQRIPTIVNPVCSQLKLPKLSL